MIRFLFFDAGNTLVFPDHARTLAPLAAAGFRPTTDQLYSAERAAKRRLDAAYRNAKSLSSVDQDFWSTYYRHLLESLGAPAALGPELVAATQRSDHWRRVRPGTRQVLEKLRAGGRRLGVIANSDGHIEDALRAAGLGDCFESFTDSGLVGSEKPDPGIFRAALESLDARAEESLYVGDIYSVDYLGATGVGMSAVLLDVAGTYREDALPRLESLEELLPHLDWGNP